MLKIYIDCADKPQHHIEACGDATTLTAEMLYAICCIYTSLLHSQHPPSAEFFRQGITLAAVDPNSGVWGGAIEQGSCLTTMTMPDQPKKSGQD